MRILVVLKAVHASLQQIYIDYGGICAECTAICVRDVHLTMTISLYQLFKITLSTFQLFAIY